MASAMTPRSFASFVCQSCRLRLKPSTTNAAAASSKRAFSSTPTAPAGEDSSASALGRIGDMNARRRAQPANDGSDDLNNLFDSLDTPTARYLNETAGRNLDGRTQRGPHRMHVLSTKHNTHITLVQAPRPATETTSSGVSITNSSTAEQKKMIDVLLSISTGQIGFRKGGRGGYDAAYQLTAFTLKQMKEKGMMRDIHKLEIVLRGFGAGREAFTKAILGAEGKNIRDKISAVVDATRLKIGGTRSPKPRRLG